MISHYDQRRFKERVYKKNKCSVLKNKAFYSSRHLVIDFERVK